MSAPWKELHDICSASQTSICLIMERSVKIWTSRILTLCCEKPKLWHMKSDPGLEWIEWKDFEFLAVLGFAAFQALKRNTCGRKRSWHGLTVLPATVACKIWPKRPLWVGLKLKSETKVEKQRMWGQGLERLYYLSQEGEMAMQCLLRTNCSWSPER